MARCADRVAAAVVRLSTPASCRRNNYNRAADDQHHSSCSRRRRCRRVATSSWLGGGRERLGRRAVAGRSRRGTRSGAGCTSPSPPAPCSAPIPAVNTRQRQCISVSVYRPLLAFKTQKISDILKHDKSLTV